MKKGIIIVSILWLVLIGASFTISYRQAQEEQAALALQAGRSFFDLIVITRAWNASHSGVYVPVTRETLPNPYLDDPARDIEVTKALTLTKINPAFMTRQISELAGQRQGMQLRITSLRPIRPENKPTAIEEEALQAFEQGVKEISRIIAQNHRQTFFYMAPLSTEKACLQCHAVQGYKEGDIRGGISISLPFTPGIRMLPMALGHLLIGLAGFLGIGIAGTKLAQSQQLLKQQSVIDYLTGIPNRLSFSGHFPKEFERARRNNQPLAVVMGDIDYFKFYNDTYGHGKGDECLKIVAQTIKDTLKRPGDFCARYGGEEFIIILPETSTKGAMFIIEEVRQAIEKEKIPHEKSLPWGIVTLSLGVAAMEGEQTITPEELIKQADMALYQAKAKGRNRVEIYRETIPTDTAGT